MHTFTLLPTYPPSKYLLSTHIHPLTWLPLRSRLVGTSAFARRPAFRSISERAREPSFPDSVSQSPVSRLSVRVRRPSLRLHVLVFISINRLPTPTIPWPASQPPASSHPTELLARLRLSSARCDEHCSAGPFPVPPFKPNASSLVTYVLAYIAGCCLCP
ncbi:hypothetical protein K440DRAFT_216608 [Wilcoxina mikolae CBS 423.85]|nr:hypothetical protein K440DRAFT_216608 [Wilcoxina mikolae CBS 423.85]